jgi:hypothetical protein
MIGSKPASDRSRQAKLSTRTGRGCAVSGARALQDSAVDARDRRLGALVVKKDSSAGDGRSAPNGVISSFRDVEKKCGTERRQVSPFSSLESVISTSRST